MKKRKINVIGLILAGALTIGTLSACNGNDNPPADTPNTDVSGDAEDDSTNNDTSADRNEGSKGNNPVKDSLIVATANEPPSVGTADHNAVAGDYMNKMTHNSLFKFNLDLEVVPDLVDEFENLNDTQWQFKLKEGVLFHNGTELTSEDVQATLIWNKQWSDCEQYTKSIESVDIIDDYTFIINTNGIQATLPGDLTHHSNAIVPKELIDDGTNLSEEPIGTGPYKFVKWNRGDSIDLEIFEDYFDKDNQPTIPYMSWKFIPEGTSRTIGLENGEIDMIIEVATTDIPRLESSDTLEVMMVPGTSHNYIMINNEKEPFDNVLLRKAMNAAINKQDIIVVAQDGLASPALSNTPSVFPGASDENVIEYDLELAKQLLEESGVDPADVVFDIIVSDEVKRRAAEVIQANLLELGITVTINQMDLAVYLDVTNTLDYTAAIGGYTSNEMSGYLKGVHHSSSIGASNRSRFNSPEVDALIDQALVTFDEDERADIMSEASALINDLHPFIPLYHRYEIRAYDGRLEGVKLSAAGRMPVEMISWADAE